MSQNTVYPIFKMIGTFICLAIFCCCGGVKENETLYYLDPPPKVKDKDTVNNEYDHIIIDATEQFISSPINPGIAPWNCEFIEVDDGWLATGTDLYYRPEYLPGAAQSRIGFIVKFNKNGVKLWERFLTTTGTGIIGEFWSTIEIADGYLLQMYYGRTSGGMPAQAMSPHPDIISIKFNKNGDLAWAKDLGINHAVANETGFVGIGGLKEATGKNVAIIQYDANGEEIWQSNIGSDLEFAKNYGLTANAIALGKIYLLPDNKGFLIRGSHLNYYEYSDLTMGPGYSWIAGFVASVTADGDLRWQKNQYDMYEIDELIVVEDGFIAMGSTFPEVGPMQPIQLLRSIKKYDFNFTLVNETSYDHFYYENNSINAIKIGDDYFFNANYSDGYASSVVIGLNTNGEVVFESDRHNGAEIGTHIFYGGIVAVENGIVILAGYRYYDIPVMAPPHEITLYFLYYDLATKTFTQSSPLF